jgi:uncharacterized protein with GYD domain
MASFLFRFRYTPESWAALIENPEDRRDMLASRVFGTYGGTLAGFWYSLSDADGYALVELPDAVAAAGVHAAVLASGSLQRLEVVELVTVEQMLEAMHRARDLGYKPPGTAAAPTS